MLVLLPLLRLRYIGLRYLRRRCRVCILVSVITYTSDTSERLVQTFLLSERRRCCSRAAPRSVDHEGAITEKSTPIAMGEERELSQIGGQNLPKWHVLIGLRRDHRTFGRQAVPRFPHWGLSNTHHTNCTSSQVEC